MTFTFSFHEGYSEPGKSDSFSVTADLYLENILIRGWRRKVEGKVVLVFWVVFLVLFLFLEKSEQILKGR